MFSRELRITPTFALLLSMAVHGSLYCLLSTGKSNLYDKAASIPIEVVYPEIRKEEIQKPIEKPVVKKISHAPVKKAPLLAPVSKPECPKDEKPAPLPKVNPLHIAESAGGNEPEPILVPASQGKSLISGAPAAAVDQSMGSDVAAGTGSWSGKALSPGGWNDSTASTAVTREAFPLYKVNPPPAYPQDARKRGFEGIVILSIFVDESGRVKNLSVFTSSGYRTLDDSALKAVKNWLFEPGMKSNKKASMWIRVPIRFELK
ncbi:MAG: energy transducer TonB [Desulfobacterales bacterium]